MTIESGALYVVATPVGNLADLSQRAREVLTGVAWVAAEDTRHSQPLLRHLGSRARLLAAHEHNEREAAARIVELLAGGEAVALVSDAGTPGVSDPGARIVAAVRSAGHRVIPLPGPCAAVVALSASGFDDAHFLFYGFLPPRAAQRRQALQALRDQPWPVVFYEAPHRVLETVGDLAALFGERRLLIGRELTKLFETIAVLPLPQAAAWLQADPHRQKGEFVLAVSAAPVAADNGEGERVLRLLLADGLPLSQAAKLAAAISGAGRKELYETALRLKDDPAT
ncbi:MAG: 16S rRNA (cytidine(1402)-2'-O)-methyltransferase [Azonexus sp.]|jgi:16S rRNA (cytidine1402-2'-O)-methyltransferase|nr:16S rRNA (cytidine(1402)-2'-O)-methyltransferase [Betaproteobacteria bacterium]MBK8917369.1 16S rRNA (cytidine(1402)-2'-O)-methyltransferase [Betaproteobacteria bacterium]MBP6035131.1 16S rRNA (cytidine(1402)-2'-O)-methyltransferase [Azonexus sp.]MBP6905891.1 16S rRNA (cytidine(1402)-2'-O)-methyltransferase [Azonexus sp.]